LLLHCAGFTTAIERESRVLGTLTADAPEGSFGEALANERLFWRNVNTQARSTAVAAHAAHVALELAGSLLRPRLIAQLAGRVLACCQLGTYARHQRRVAELTARAIKPKRTSDHVRIDASHDVPLRTEAARARQFAR